eukprot:674432-Rhodomonas_salina.2
MSGHWVRGERRVGYERRTAAAFGPRAVVKEGARVERGTTLWPCSENDWTVVQRAYLRVEVDARDLVAPYPPLSTRCVGRYTHTHISCFRYDHVDIYPDFSMKIPPYAYHSSTG